MTGVQGKWVGGSLCTSLLLEKTSTVPGEIMTNLRKNGSDLTAK
jgi:hypothetical protein